MNFVGTAGWSLPRASAKHFPKAGTHLERYARVLNGVEINSSFYRAHSFATYQRWAKSTPATFRFAVKMPRTITHDGKLRRARDPLTQFLSEVKGLGRKLGPLLIQLPPSLSFESRVASRFFQLLRELHKGTVIIEPRHATWFELRVERLLIQYGISRVAADPAKHPKGGTPGGATRRLVYYRLHGSPRIYWSDYSREQLRQWSNEIQKRRSKETWIIFDNTAAGYATANALRMRKLLEG